MPEETHYGEQIEDAASGKWLTVTVRGGREITGRVEDRSGDLITFGDDGAKEYTVNTDSPNPVVYEVRWDDDDAEEYRDTRVGKVVGVGEGSEE